MTDFSLYIKETSKMLGQENIDCLTNIFKEIDGQPPCVEKKRYRANYPIQIEALNYLEHSAHLIVSKTYETQQFYHLRPFAIPLIKTQKAQDLLNLMCLIYSKLPDFYKERLDENVTSDDLLKAIDAPNEKILEALYYFSEAHSIWNGWGKGFPYEKGSHINISEDVLLKESFLEVLTDYYRWNFTDKKEHYLEAVSKKENYLQKIEVKDKKVGRPSIKEKIIAAYEHLKERNIIDYSKTLKSHTEIIQKTVQALDSDITGTAGMEHEAIRRAISERFQADKNNL